MALLSVINKFYFDFDSDCVSCWCLLTITFYLFPGLEQTDERYIKTLSCRFCHKLFSCASDVRRHERLHTGEKPYKCATCGKSFAEKGDLYQHRRFHTGEKPYSCVICGKSFTTNSNLKRHAVGHLKM